HGAFSYLAKPATTNELEGAFDRLKGYLVPHTKRLLVIEDDERERASIVELLAHEDIEIEGVGSGNEGLEALRTRSFDCCVVDLRLPDMSGFELLEKVQAEAALRDIPIVVFTGKVLDETE